MKWPTRRQGLLLGVSAVAGLAVLLSGGAGDGSVKGKTQPAIHKAPSQGPAPATHVELERLHQQKVSPDRNAAIGNAFKSKSWYVPPPPPPVVAVEPVAPPVPFTYLGRYEDQPPVVVILAKGDRVYTVSEGEVIDGTYRVDHIGEDAVSLVYLPMNVNQSLSTRAAPENSAPRAGYADRYRRP